MEMREKTETGGLSDEGKPAGYLPLRFFFPSESFAAISTIACTRHRVKKKRYIIISFYRYYPLRRSNTARLRSRPSISAGKPQIYAVWNAKDLQNTKTCLSDSLIISNEV